MKEILTAQLDTLDHCAQPQHVLSVPNTINYQKVGFADHMCQNGFFCLFFFFFFFQKKNVFIIKAYYQKGIVKKGLGAFPRQTSRQSVATK